MRKLIASININELFKRKKKLQPFDIEKEMREGRMTNCANYWIAKEDEKYLAKLN